MKFFLFAYFFTFYAFSNSIESIMEEVTIEAQKTEVKDCKTKNNATISLVNKIEGKVEFLELTVNKKEVYENLEFTLKKCCTTNIQSYGFFVIYNNKIKKEVFKSWTFSKTSSANSLEDAKFDATLIKCY